GTVTAGSAGANLAIGSLPVGTYTLIASYSGTSSFNPSSSQAPVTIAIQYRLDGFLQPINDTAHQQLAMSVFKAGSTVPVKLQLKDITGNVVQAANLPVWVNPQNVGTTSAPIDESVYTDQPSSGSAFRWDATGQQYIYNWQTPKNAGQVWRICAKFDDLQQQCVNIGLK